MQSLVGQTIAGKYQIIREIGRGSFGEIFQALNLTTKMMVGIKVEKSDHDYPQLTSECRIYDELKGGPGIPHIYWYGSEDNLNFLVMDLLGLSCEALFLKCNRKFSLKTVLLIAYQMILRIEYLHNNLYIHRDVKPENFVVGTGPKENFIYIIDFGLCKKYRNWRTNEHIPYIEEKSLTGTARYASLNTHLGIEQSRRDDLECLAYVFIYFLKGKLPWQEINASEKQDRYEAIKQIKLSMPINEICSDLPNEFSEFLRYSRQLGFDEDPDYSYLKTLFEGLRCRNKFEFDYMFDWTKIEKK